MERKWTEGEMERRMDGWINGDVDRNMDSEGGRLGWIEGSE